MTYADRTTVPVEKTKTEIETTLARYGATRFAYFVGPDDAVIIFEAHDRRLRFNLPLEEGTNAKAERLRRQRWRALLLCIKAKLESVASNIETFEEAFLAHVVMPDNRTVYEHTAPRIAQVAKGGELQPLLPAPGA
jgi:hypothetical protein